MKQLNQRSRKRKYTTRKVTSVLWRDEGAGCSDCGRAVRPRLGAARSGTGFPGLAAASKKFPVEHSPPGAGAADAAVDVGGGGSAGRGREGQARKPL